MKRHSRTLLRIVAAGAMIAAGASPVAAHAGTSHHPSAATQPSASCRTTPRCGFYDSHGFISAVDAHGMGYVRDRSGTTHVIHLGKQPVGLTYMQRSHSAAPGRRGWSERLVPGSRRLGLVRGVDPVALAVSPRNDLLYLVVQAADRLYVVSKEPQAHNFPAITAADLAVPSGLATDSTQQLAVAAMPGHKLAILTSVATSDGRDSLEVLFDKVAPLTGTSHVQSQALLGGSNPHFIHGDAYLSYDPNQEQLLAAATFGHDIFAWQGNQDSPNSWQPRQHVGDARLMTSLATMHGHAYIGLDGGSTHPGVFITHERLLGIDDWSAHQRVPHSPVGASGLLLTADVENGRLQAVYTDGPTEHQVRSASGSWSVPNRVSPRGELDTPDFLVLTNTGGFRFAYECEKNCA